MTNDDINSQIKGATNALRDNAIPTIMGSAIRRLTISANNFELKPALIQMVQSNQFGGYPNESPDEHISGFLQYCNTVFYLSLDETLRSLVDAATGGALMGKNYDEASALIEKMAPSAYNWQNERSKSRVASVNDMDTIANLTAQILALTTQLSNRPSGSLPSNTEENPKGVNSIMLRSCKELDTVNRKAQTQDESPEKRQRKLGLGECKETHVTLQLADKSIKYPKGIIENVLVKVDKLIFPHDFIVLEMEEDKEVPMILGRLFLATGKALINVEQGKLTLRVMDEQITFNVYDAIKKFDDGKSRYTIDIIDELISESVEEKADVNIMELVLRDLDEWSDDDEPEEECVKKVSEIKTRYYEELGTSATTLGART
ncbi:hypothetical protein CRG98_030686 [Punica granatum]|uniref:Uncharacterized protein n=1 Tax=Punica granatum TaxID=22663 RepID=A0A2I0IZ17_PUNGR|nr:hypothetical protein CRG98_030686 [Punica granatum]